MFLAPCTECNLEDLGNSTFLNGQGKVNVANGLICYSGVSSGSIATLQCNDGYRALSILNRTCMFDGQWSEGALECVIVDEETISPRKLDLSFLVTCLINVLCYINIYFVPQCLSLLIHSAYCGVTLTVIVSILIIS